MIADRTGSNRFVRVLLGGALALLLNGCVTPSVIQPRLGEENFSTWIDQFNADAARINARMTTTDRKQRLSALFSELADSLKSRPGEASVVVREWRDNSGNLTTLFDYFLSRDLLLNYYSDELGGALLLPLERDRLGLNTASDALNGIFGNDSSYVAPWLVNEPTFVYGTAYGATAIVNRVRAKQLYALMRESIGTRGYAGATLSEGVIMQLIAANEVAHATLSHSMGFTIESPIDRDALLSDLPGLKLRNARQVHEFISDAASVRTHPAALYALTSNLLHSLESGPAGELRVSGTQPYAPAAAFFANAITTVLNRLGRPPRFDEMLKQWRDAPAAVRDALVLRFSTELIIELGQRGYGDLVDDYTLTAATLVERIRATSQ